MVRIPPGAVTAMAGEAEVLRLCRTGGLLTVVPVPPVEATTWTPVCTIVLVESVLLTAVEPVVAQVTLALGEDVTAVAGLPALCVSLEVCTGGLTSVTVGTVFTAAEVTAFCALKVPVVRTTVPAAPSLLSGAGPLTSGAAGAELSDCCPPPPGI